MLGMPLQRSSPHIFIVDSARIMSKSSDTPVAIIDFDSLKDVEPVSTLAQLLTLDRERFVECCYLSLLYRPADDGGMVIHLRMLDEGVDPIDIAYHIARSAEAHEKKSHVSPLAREVLQAKLEKLITSAHADDQMTALLTTVNEQLEVSAGGNTQLPYVERRAGYHDPSQRKPTVVARASSEWAAPAPKPGGRLWLDLTTAFEWQGGVVGIVRAELEMACKLKALDPELKFSMQYGEGFAEIEAEQIHWLLSAQNVTEAYMDFFGRKPGQYDYAKYITVEIPSTPGFFHPYSAGDIVLSLGWIDSQKENYFEILKSGGTDVRIAYLIYDIIMALDQTKHFYQPHDRDRFFNYLAWVSQNADFLLFGGETAKRDMVALQQSQNWPSPEGQAVKFGADIVGEQTDSANDDSLLEALSVTEPFIMTVGSIEGRKNHETLYRAYLLALQEGREHLPMLVICGRPYGADDLVDRFDRDPRLKGRVVRISPTDLELAALYRRCLFTLLPSLYEGWSLTLPESLQAGKFCIASNVDPLREVGRDLVDYVSPYDVRGWAEAILKYASQPDLLVAKEAHIRSEWKPIRWSDTAVAVKEAITTLGLKHPHAERRQKRYLNKPTIWMDLTLTFLQWERGVTGVIRAELTYAYHLKKLAPNTRFFAWQGHAEGSYFIEINDDLLLWLFNATDLTTAYKQFHDFWLPREREGNGYRNPFGLGRPTPGHPAYLTAFPNNSIVFLAGIDFGVLRTRQLLDLVSPERRVMTSQIFYDFTPFLLPQFHIPQTPEGYTPFFDFISTAYDHIVYGGRTAQRDGILIQQERGLRSPASDFVEFGSDIAIAGVQTTSDAHGDDAKVLADLGVTSRFVMTVGTIEPRKNHEMLYKAYLEIIERDQLKEPLQMIFVGHRGWKTEDFLAVLLADDRIKGKLLWLTPTDDQLEVLYRHAAFTLLASFYEGWSLTLPEKLSHGKFCLVSDVDPLRETGGDLVEYIDPLDTFKWAERIEYYANHPREVSKRVTRIKKEWKPKSWEAATADLIEVLHDAHKTLFAS